MKPIVSALTFSALILVTSPLLAGEIGQASITHSQFGPSSWQYDILVTDSGNANIGTFWFSWIPGEDFMPDSPTNVLSPTGWSDSITHGGSSDGYAIMWSAASNPITPGNSLAGFQFDSDVSPSTMDGNSPFYAGTPILTATVYSGAAFSDGGNRFVAQDGGAAAPEPASATLFSAGVLLVACWRLQRSRCLSRTA